MRVTIGKTTNLIFLLQNGLIVWFVTIRLESTGNFLRTAVILSLQRKNSGKRFFPQLTCVRLRLKSEKRAGQTVAVAISTVAAVTGSSMATLIPH